MRKWTAEEIADVIISQVRRTGYGFGGSGTDRAAVVAVDGRCASGKSTAADILRAKTGCSIIRMDHFFLRPEQRTTERLAEPGGNYDRERFLEEAALPLSQGRPFSYRPWNCKRLTFGNAVPVNPADGAVIEGCYSCHPALRFLSTLRVFMSADYDVQLARIEARNGAQAAAVFKDKWIPLEELYFSSLKIQESSGLVFYT